MVLKTYGDAPHFDVVSVLKMLIRVDTLASIRVDISSVGGVTVATYNTTNNRVCLVPGDGWRVVNVLALDALEAANED